jgi:hypothetical protein
MLIRDSVQRLAVSLPFDELKANYDIRWLEFAMISED